MSQRIHQIQAYLMIKIDNFHSLEHTLSSIPAILNFIFLWVLFNLYRNLSDSSYEEYTSENTISSSTFNSPNIDSIILWRLSVISELDLNPDLSNLYLSSSFFASFMLISTSEFVLSSVFLFYLLSFLLKHLSF